MSATVQRGSANGAGRVPVKHERRKKMTPLRGSFYPSFLKGLTAAYEGAIIASNSGYVKKTWKRYIKQFCITLAILSCVVLAFVYPVRFILWLFSFIIDDSEVQDSLSTLNVIWELVLFMPMILTVTMSVIHPGFSDKVFLDAMGTKDPALAAYLREQKPANFGRTIAILIRNIQRKIPLILIGIGILLLSCLPYIGQFAFPLAQFGLTYRIFGAKFSLVLAIVSSLPYISSAAPIFVKLWLASFSLGRDLLEVYFSRLRSVKQEEYIKRQYFAEILGFGLPYTILMSVPIIGIPIFAIAQGAACCALEVILEEQAQRVSQSAPGTLAIKGQELLLADDVQEEASDKRV